MSKESRFSFINNQLSHLREQGLYRVLDTPAAGIDFNSNDYLGLARQPFIKQDIYSGSGASRLISGNYELIEEAEQALANYYQTEAALIFPSGFQANVGLFQALSGRNDLILYDELCHASIRDGIRLSHARAFSFRHNDVSDLILKAEAAVGNIFIVTEGIFSMDGDEANLPDLAAVCRSKGLYLILDEAHSAGITGLNGSGLASQHQLEDICVAKMIGLGKSHGCQGGAILGSAQLRELLINKHRGIIYSTGMSPLLASAILDSVKKVEEAQLERNKLSENILHFKQSFEQLVNLPLKPVSGPIQALITGGNETTVLMAKGIQNEGFRVSAVRYPSVPKGTERIRLILHSYNTFDEIDRLFESVNRNFFEKK